jgi:hypothetical protein
VQMEARVRALLTRRRRLCKAVDGFSFSFYFRL